jgi:hypothetical protein
MNQWMNDNGWIKIKINKSMDEWFKPIINKSMNELINERINLWVIMDESK